MKGKIPVVAIIGRTNVGKSTLFNALVGKRVSIVKDEHGVTRDRTSALIRKDNFAFTLIDTAGLFGGKRDAEFELSVKAQTNMAIEESDLVIALFDGVQGVHPHDSDVAAELRKTKKPVLWVINKCEKPQSELNSSEFYTLGAENIVCVSAAHRRGLKELLAAIKGFFPDVLLQTEEEIELDENRPIQVAILGKPNVGKSTIVNKLVGEERLVTSNVAGTTRDSIDIPFSFKDRDFVLIDTAGLRKKARVKGVTVERYANLRTLSALARCDVAVLLLDATQGPPTDQDLKIAELIHERGRGLVIAINKWDAIEKDHKTAKQFKDVVNSVFRFTRYAPILFVSALSGKRCTTVMDYVIKVYKSGKERIKTADLNRIVSKAFEANQPPVFRGEPVKLYFATQIAIAPPTIVLFLNYPRRISGAYERYIKNALREEFPFEGYDIKLLLRKRTEKADRREQLESANA